MPSCVSLECLGLWRDRGHSEMLSQGRVEKAFDGGLIFFCLFLFICEGWEGVISFLMVKTLLSIDFKAVVKLHDSEMSQCYFKPCLHN